MHEISILSLALSALCVSLYLTLLFLFSFRVRTQLYGFMDLVQEQCQLFPLTHITAFRDKISKQAHLGKANSHHRAMDLWGAILISTMLRLVSHWINNSNKTFAMDPWLVHKSSQSSLSNNRYGKTATKSYCLPCLFGGLVMSVKVAFRAVSLEITIVHDP